MSICQHRGGARFSKAFYRVVAELCQAAQLCVFILGMRYLSLGVLKHVFGVRYGVSILVKRRTSLWRKIHL